MESPCNNIFPRSGVWTTEAETPEPLCYPPHVFGMLPEDLPGKPVAHNLWPLCLIYRDTVASDLGYWAFQVDLGLSTPCECLVVPCFLPGFYCQEPCGGTPNTVGAPKIAVLLSDSFDIAMVSYMYTSNMYSISLAVVLVIIKAYVFRPVPSPTSLI